MRTPNKLLILVLFLFNLITVLGQDINIKSKVEKIEIYKDSSFKRSIIVELKKSDNPQFYPIFYDTELESISDIEIFEKKGKRFKKHKKIKVIEEKFKIDYINSKKIKSVYIPEGKKICLKYSIDCDELMYFSSLNFFSYDNIDTLNYQITIPNQFDLSYKISNRKMLDYFQLDSLKTNANSSWNIKVKPLKVKHDPLQYFGIYKNMEVPLIRTIIHPKSFKYKARKYMNDWYLNKILSTRGLSDTAKKKIDNLTKNTNDTKEIIDILYNYVKGNFKYVAIEIGMGAFIPSSTNVVFSNKQGDCKDLSNFLSEALNYKGINSKIALAATFDHILDCDFPSLSSANHVICVVELDGEKVLLDPTDPIHIQGTPVQSLQNRNILIINSDGGLFYKVKPFTPEQNLILYNLDLRMISKKNNLNGTFSIKYNGVSDNYLQRSLKFTSKNNFNTQIKSHFENVFGNQFISSLNFSNTSNKLNFKGNLNINGKFVSDDSKKYLFIDFIPKLIETEERENLLEGTILENCFQKKANILIHLDEPIKLFDSKIYEYKEENILLNFKIETVNNNELKITYDFIFNNVIITKENKKTVNNALNFFKNILDEPVILEKK